MDLLDKLTILSDAAKYDAACTSSGVKRGFQPGKIGSTSSSIAGCCHSFSADGRCITLLKVLMTNCCSFDCKYCVNRRSNDVRRAIFTPKELADLTIEFYRRNYIEGLFLSSGVLRSPDYTTELMIRSLRILRHEYGFNGYIHAKAIPGTSPELVQQLGDVRRVVVLEEVQSGSGIGHQLAYLLKDRCVTCLDLGEDFVTHGKLNELYRERRLDGSSVKNTILEVLRNED